MKIYLAMILLAVGSHVMATPECVDGVMSGDVCYFVRKSPLGVNKEEAMSECESEGATLAVISSGSVLSAIRFHFPNHYRMEMLLTALEYDQSVNRKFPLLPNGEKVPYEPDWFLDHPIRQKGHGEIVYIPNRNDKFNGFMNVADGARFSHVLCAK